MFIAAFFTFNGCETDESDPAGQRNVGVVPLITDLKPGIFDSKDLVNSYIQFTVSFTEGQEPENVEIVGSYNGNLSRISLGSVTSSFPATVKLVSGEVISKLGIDASTIVNGDVFTIELVTTYKGVKTRSNAAINVAVACAFDPLLTVGSYHAEYESSWGTTGDVTLSADSEDEYTIYVTGLAEIEGLTEDKGPLVMHIDPVTYALTIDKTILASACGSYHNYTIEGSGTYSSCDGSFTTTVKLTVSEGSYGTYSLVLTKK